MCQLSRSLRVIPKARFQPKIKRQKMCLLCSKNEDKNMSQSDRNLKSFEYVHLCNEQFEKASQLAWDTVPDKNSFIRLLATLAGLL